MAVDAEITLIHASNNSDAGIDPRIGKIPNLGSYKSYQLLSQSNMTIKKAPTTTTLPNGRILQISLKDVKDKQYIIDTSINQPGGTAFLPLLEVRASVGVPVFIAGQSYQGGMLIIAIKIREVTRRKPTNAIGTLARPRPRDRAGPRLADVLGARCAAGAARYATLRRRA